MNTSEPPCTSSDSLYNQHGPPLPMNTLPNGMLPGPGGPIPLPFEFQQQMMQQQYFNNNNNNKIGPGTSPFPPPPNGLFHHPHPHMNPNNNNNNNFPPENMTQLLQNQQQQQFIEGGGKLPHPPPFHFLSQAQQHQLQGKFSPDGGRNFPPPTPQQNLQQHQNNMMVSAVNSPLTPMPNNIGHNEFGGRPGSNGFPANFPPPPGSIPPMSNNNMQQFPQNIPPNMMLFNNSGGPPSQQQLQFMRNGPSPYVGSPPGPAMPQPSMTACSTPTKCNNNSGGGGLSSQQPFPNSNNNNAQPRAFIFTTAMLNDAIQSNMGNAELSLAEWHQQNIVVCSTQPSTSAAALCNNGPATGSAAEMTAAAIFSQQQQTAAQSPNLNNIGAGMGGPSTPVGGGGRGTKRKMQHSISESMNAMPSPHFPGQPQSVPSFDGMKLQGAGDCGAPLSAPDPSLSMNGDFRRPASLNHGPGSAGDSINNYLSPTMTPGSVPPCHLDDNPLKKMEMMTNKCEPTNKMARFSSGNGPNETNIDFKTREEKLAALHALEQKTHDLSDHDGMPMEPMLLNGLRPPPLGLNGPLPPGHPMMAHGPGGPLPPQFDPQMAGAMGRHPGMPPMLQNGPFPHPNGGPGGMSGHPGQQMLPPQFIQGPNGPMMLPPGMRPPMGPGGPPFPPRLMPPPGQMMVSNMGPEQGGGPPPGMMLPPHMMGPQQGMLHSPRFPPNQLPPGMQPMPQQMNPGTSNTPPMFYQGQPGGGPMVPQQQRLVEGCFPPPHMEQQQQQFIQSNGPMPPTNGMIRPPQSMLQMRPGGGINGGGGGDPSPFWAQGPGLPQPLTNLDSRIPILKMQYTANNTPNGSQQQHVIS